MRVARECKQRVHVEVRVYRISQGRQTVCAGAPSLGDTLAACARPPVAPPFVDGRKSVPSICVEIPRGPKSRGPVTACPVVPSLSATLADRAPARASTADPDCRWSKIGPIKRPCQHACNHRCDRIPNVRQTARAAAPSLSGTLTYGARPRGRSPDTKDCAIKKCSARLLTDPKERLPAKVEYALRGITWVLVCVRLRVRHRSGLPVVHSVSGN
jgi:hypothetical protein